MNRCFSVVWNTTRKAWVVASELARRSGKSGKVIRTLGTSLMLGLTTLVDPVAAIAGTLTDDEEARRDWVQMQSLGASYGLQPSLLAAGRFAYEAGGGSAAGDSSIAIGSAATTGAGAWEAIAIGREARVLDNNYRSIAIGNEAVVDANPDEWSLTTSAIALGDRSRVGSNSWDSVAVGFGAQVADNADHGVALGSSAMVQSGSSDATALGRAASAGHANSVALGAFSTTDRADSVAVGGRQITGVTAGTQIQDAVNLGQLTQTNQAVSNLTGSLESLNETVTTLGGNALQWDGSAGAYKASRNNLPSRLSGVAAGAVNAQSADAVNGAQLHQTNERVGALETGMSHSGQSSYLKANSSKAEATATGSDSLAAGPAASSSGASSVAIGDGTQASAARSTALGASASATHANSVALGAGSMTDRSNSLSIGSAGNERQITHVAAGSADTDAVNVAQLRDAASGSAAAVVKVDQKVDAVDTRVTQVRGDVSKLQNGEDGMFQTNNSAQMPKPKASGSNSTAGGAGAIASGAHGSALGSKAQASGEKAVAVGAGAQAKARNSVALGADSVADRQDSVSVGRSGATRQITNVAAGTQATDAVNLGQLNTGLNSAKAYTDNAFRGLHRQIEELDDELSAGIAGAMAMAALPQPHAPGASMTSLGAGSFRGESSIAVGISTLSKDGKWTTKMQGSSDSQGEIGVSVGVGYQWE